MILFLFLWIVALGVAFVWLLFAAPALPRGRELAIIGVLAAVARFVPLLVFREPHGLWTIDINAYLITASDVLDWRDVYLRDFFVHPYLPFQMYVFAAAKLVADATPVPFFTAARVPQALADVGTALLLTRAASRMWGWSEGARTGLLYALCPFPVLVTIYHGQFDAISVFFATAAVSTLYEPDSARASARSAALLALGILQKLWPAFLFPLLLARVRGDRRFAYSAIVGGIIGGAVLAYMLGFGSSPQRIYDGVFRYNTPYPEAGGPPLILHRFLGSVPGSDALFRFEVHHGEWVAYAAALAAMGWLVVRRAPLYEAGACVLAVLFALMNDGSLYHHLWIIPLGLLAGQRLFVAAVVLTHSAYYVIIGFIGGAMFFPGVEGPGTQWLGQHAHWFT
ncbi:MAG: DUF2029 domain-containing protein, partial [Chloroflexi bacterium]|nr:DUF2029 domain-containing protein [Chloroflexota bacterium]